MMWAADWEFGYIQKSTTVVMSDHWTLQQCNQSGFTVVQLVETALGFHQWLFIYISVKALGQSAESGRSVSDCKHKLNITSTCVSSQTQTSDIYFYSTNIFIYVNNFQALK